MLAVWLEKVITQHISLRLSSRVETGQCVMWGSSRPTGRNVRRESTSVMNEIEQVDRYLPRLDKGLGTASVAAAIARGDQVSHPTAL